MAAAVVGLIMIALLGSCSARTDRTAAPSVAQSGGGQAGRLQAAGGQPAGAGPSQATPLAEDTPRQVISTAALRLEVGDVTRVTARAGQLAVEAGGFVAASEESGAGAERRSQVTLKVPGDRFDGLLGSLAGLGEVRSKQLSTEDVTDQVVDLDARLGATRASADRLQQLIARAATVGEVVGVEAELAKRDEEIESFEGRLRVLRNKVDLATVNLDVAPRQSSADDHLPTFVSGLRGGLRAMRTTAVVGSVVVGALLPWIVLVAVVGFVARLLWRRSRRRRPPGPGPTPPPGVEAG